MQVKVKDNLLLTGFSGKIAGEVCMRMTFTNPKWTENNRMGRWNGKTPRVLRYYEHDGDGLTLPRGFTGQLIRLCRAFGEPFELVDQRRELPEVHFSFGGELRTYQEKAVTDMIRKDFGTLAAPTGSGKTVIALHLIAQRRQPALVVVHTKELLHQWIKRIEAFLGIPKADVGVIGSGKKTIGKKISVALVQSLYKCADAVAPQIGHLIVDECHRAPARTFTEAVAAFDSKYMTGLSATPWRRDKLSRLIFWHLGDVQHSIEAGDLVESGNILQAEPVFRETAFQPFSDPSTEYVQMLKELTEDPARNELIASDVAEAASNGAGVCLVLSDRKAHCQALQERLAGQGVRADILTGDLPKTDRQAVVQRLNGGAVKVLVATGQLLGEGFDCKELSTLFLATPIRFSGRVLQYLGRVLRPAAGKEKAVVYDYVDTEVGVLRAAARARGRVLSGG